MFMWVFPNYILPFPEAYGFRNLTIGYFALFFSIMDVATGPACERFVSQYAEIDPKKALRYVQFFIWFQILTGIVQITMVTVFCFVYIIHTDLNYAFWFFLIYSLTQYPGMLGAFNSTLKGFQRFDKSNVVDILQTVVFENITQITFILIGRAWGLSNPLFGELMGATVGFIIGRYVDDFFAMLVSGKFLANILKPYGISITDVFYPGFHKAEAVESLKFGFKLFGAEIISWATEYITLVMMINWVPNYIAIMGYLEIAKTVASAVNLKYDFTAFMSQSYNNDKKKLAQYIATAYVKHWWYIAFFVALEISMLVPPVLKILGGEYGNAAWIIPLYIFPRLMVMPATIGADMLQACHRPELRTVGIIIEKVTKMLTVFLFLNPNGLIKWVGIENIIFLYIMHDIPAYIAITIAEFYFVNKYCVPVRINFWQTFVAGTLASLPLIPINLIILYFLNLIAAFGNIIWILLYVVGAFLMFFFLFPGIMFFFYGLVGGWDDASVKAFQKAATLSGPSKFFVSIFARWTYRGHTLCPWRNRFAISFQDAERELVELMQEKVQ